MAVNPKVRVTVYPQKFVAAISEEFAKRTARAAEVVKEDLRNNLSTPGNGQPSKPGEFPRMQSGKMYRGVKTVVAKRSPYTVRIVNRAAHNDFQEFGTAGGKIITPVRAKALRFTVGGASGRNVIYTKRVKQGAIKARAQGRRTLEEAREKIRKIYTRGIRDMLKGNKAIVRLG